jgi:membrane associated rhomboid family serine protease
LGLDPSQLRITRGAMILAFGEIGMTLVWLLSPLDARNAIVEWLAASHHGVWEQGRVWTLATSPFINPSFVGLLLHALMLWTFLPTLERFWGTQRFLRFAAVTSLAGTIAGTAMGFATGGGAYIAGLDPFIWASIVAYGIIYSRHPVQFFGVLPLTARQLMYGFIGFLALKVLLGQEWDVGAAIAASMGTAALMVSKRWSPGLAVKRWRIARARKKLTVMQGGAAPAVRKAKRDERFIN